MSVKPNTSIDFPVFQQRLIDLRKAHRNNLTQTANIIGMDRRDYANWEKGTVTKDGIKGIAPKLENIIRLADYYNVSVDYLLGRSDFIAPENEYINIETGLTDDAIAELRNIQLLDETSTDNIPLMDLLNFMLKTNYMTNMLEHLRNFISPEYRFPAYRDENGNYKVSSLSEYALHLASKSENITPWDIHTIMISDQYLDSIEMRNVESTFHFMRRRWNDEHIQE